MTAPIKVAQLAEQVAALCNGDDPHRSIAVVVPLAEGRSDVVREFLAEGPPFDPAGVGLEHHKVFLTDREVVFVFETEEGVKAFERILAEAEFWEVIGAWERNLSEEPRVGAAVYEWPEHPHNPGPVAP